MREITCDHAVEDAIKHPVAQYVFFGNVLVGMCHTCYTALKGQVYEREITDKLKALEQMHE